MNNAGVAALYGAITFAILAGAYVALVHFALGWPAVPEASRVQGMVMLAWYVVAGMFARNVGQHAGRGATLGQAWREGLRDFGRSARGLLFK